MEKLKQELKCPLCKENVFSEAGEGCKMCGMPLKFLGERFCSEKCKKEYNQINRKLNLNGGKNG